MKFGLEVAWSVLGILVTAFATVMLVRDLGGLMRRSFALHETGVFTTQVLFTAVFLFLIYGNALYQFARLGYLMRLRRHRRRPRAALDAVYDEASPPTVCMLIPSYKEEATVVRQSVLSCALQDWPERRVVLLIDDPYDPPAAADREALERMQRVPAEVSALLESPASWCREAAERFEAELRAGLPMDERVLTALEALLDRVAGWFEEQGARESRHTHTDRLFVALTFHERARAERQRRDALRAELADLTPSGAVSRVRREYRRLARLFEAEITSFQRKRYVNLSDEPNKAMNLNGYIGLMGGTYRETELQGRSALVPAGPGEDGVHIPDAEFLLTLDADSLLAPDYALRLLDVARAPGNERVAVIQTPYSSVPGAPGVLERVAGATTDLQYVIHQGFTACRATYWVGANALLRRAALDDIVVETVERGFPVRRYIQDRTVIEDTESSIDLVARGWSLYNYPERLSYSATPPDFGSLVIQRRRWANGGLIILPKLMRHLVTQRPSVSWLGEGFMRFHYLTSIAAVNLGVLLILVYPIERYLLIAWLPLTALPYYVLYAWDLVLAGFSWTDVGRVYALNLLLIPVNLAGVFKSVQQMVLRNKIPFWRTPKIEGRTLAPTSIVAMQFALIGYCVLGTLVDGWSGRWLNAVFAAANAAILLYAMKVFIGLRDGAYQIRRAAETSPLVARVRRVLEFRRVVAREDRS